LFVIDRICDRPGAGKGAVGACGGIAARIQVRIACGTLLIGKRSQRFNFFLRQIQGVGFHAAIGAVDQGSAL